MVTGGRGLADGQQRDYTIVKVQADKNVRL